MSSNDAEDAGGWGADSAPDLRDTRMQERAIRERWPMSAAVRVKVLKRLCRIVDEEAVHGPLPPPDHREVISAARALLSADKLNLEQEKFDHARSQSERGGSMKQVHELMGGYCDPDEPRGPGPDPGVLPTPG